MEIGLGGLRCRKIFFTSRKVTIGYIVMILSAAFTGLTNAFAKPLIDIEGFQTMKVQLRQISRNGLKKIIIQHDLGKNWPHLIAELNELLNELGYRIINDEYNKRGFSFEIISVRDD